MHFRKRQDALSVLDAVDNLSLMAELGIEVEKEREETIDLMGESIDEHLGKRSWNDPKNLAFNLEKVKNTFKTLLAYLTNLFEKDEMELKKKEVQRGIQAMMTLAMEAALNLDRFLNNSPEGRAIGKVTEMNEYRDLQQYYLSAIAPKFPKIEEKEERWEEEWGVGTEEEILKRGINDFESVRLDRDYDLFLIRRQDGGPFFNRALFRHMHLVELFDELLVSSEEEDPLLKAKILQDREIHLSAKEILRLASPQIDEFYRVSMKFKHLEGIAALNKAIMALLLAANQRNLAQTTADKNCLNYFADFHYYLRKTLASQEYHRFVNRPPPSSERTAHALMNLAHQLCAQFFMRTSYSKELKKLIRTLIAGGSVGSEVQSPTHSPLSFWNVLTDEDEQIRTLLRRSPQGPLKLTIDLFDDKRQMTGFDPLSQHNLPSQLFTASNEDLHLSCLRIPSPTSQELINKVDIVEEFQAFLRALGSSKRNQTHLMINLQDRTSWQDHARCQALEKLPSEEVPLTVITLAKNTDFYFQREDYLHLDTAKEFMEQFQQQIEGGEECGFYFPSSFKQELKQFIKNAMEVVHELFFGAKRSLVRKNRLDFIEIFYLFLSLKAIEVYKPDTLSFTSKDSIDHGPAESMQLFVVLRLLSAKTPLTEEEKDTIRWILYGSALVVRERAIDLSILRRSCSACSIIHAEWEAHYKEVVAACQKLFNVLKELQVKEI